MVRRSIRKLTNYIGDYNGYNEEMKSEIEYSLISIMFEIIKICIIIILFGLLGLIKESSLILLVMALTKPFMGGYHEDTQLKCLITTIIIITITISLSINTSFNIISLYLINSLSIFIIYHRAPIISENMPLTKVSLIRRNRVLALIGAIIFSIIALILRNEKIYSEIITWTILIEVCLMFNKKKK